MEIKLEKILQDLGLERYIVRRLEEKILNLQEEIKKLNKETDELQKLIKQKVEDV